jgi:hypothetical protein
MADLTIQDVVEGGLNASYASAASGGDALLNLDGEVFLHVKNGDASSHTVTITAQDGSQEVPGFGTMTKANLQVSVPASGDRFIGPFPRAAFNDANGKVQITYDAVTNVTIAALRLKRAV